MELKEESGIAERNSDQDVGDENRISHGYECSDYNESCLSALAPLPLSSSFIRNKDFRLNLTSSHGFMNAFNYSFASRSSATSSNFQITKERRESMLKWKEEEMGRKLMDLGKNNFQ